MGVLVYILGRSGTGKSYSMRNFSPDDISIINVQGKILPFKGAGKFNITSTDNSADIVDCIKSEAKRHKVIVVDDFQYVMANEFMRRSAEKGYDKFTEIGRHAWDIANCVRELPSDVIVYVLCHTDTDQDGFERLKTIGKLLDDKIVLEGMSTIVLKTAVSDGQYTFLTQNNGHDTVKSPAGMFPSLAIENDLKYVDDKIRNYFEIGDFKSDEEMAKADDAAKTDVDPNAKKSRKNRRNSEEAKKVQEDNETAVANVGVTDDPKEDAVPFDEVEMPEVKEPPRRKRRSAEPVEKEQEELDEPKEQEEPEEVEEPEEHEEPAQETTPRRRRRRA